ncbi:MAG: FHA domain-containing protein [Verrucomicrobiales bacterium]|nr:FHA domain-containing protein [Verrucomicrobiales bacterium]
MLELEVLSGKLAGRVYPVRQFPFLIGRSESADLQLDEPGVWQKHAAIEFCPNDGFVLVTQPQATALVNGQVAARTRLRAGDVVECGSFKFRVWLSPVRQGRGVWYEAAVWVLLSVALVGEIILIGFLTRQ